MKIVLSTETVAGTRRGGEDLHLLLEAEVPGVTDAELDEALADLDRHLDKLFAELAVDEDGVLWTEVGFKDTADGTVAVVGGRLVSHPTEHYEFQLDWDLAEARAKAAEDLRDHRRWRCQRRYGDEADVRWRFRRSFYVTGNAD